MTVGRKLAALAAGLTLVPVLAQAAFAAEPAAPAEPVRALEAAAHELRSTEPGAESGDLRAFGRMVGDAQVVGMGEATHGSHEFFTVKERVFRYLVEKKGFTTFALEASWSGGVRLDEYLRTGKGDLRAIAKEVLRASPWEREELVGMLEWMREHNRRDPGRPLHVMGDDFGAPKIGEEVFARVAQYVRGAHPDSTAHLAALYEGLRPLDDFFAYLNRPLDERRQLAGKAQQALDLLLTLGGPKASAAYDSAVQDARFIAQTAKFAGYDLADKSWLSVVQRYRDQVMADNTVWWLRHHGGKILMSAQNTHAGYVADEPALYPKTQGSYLRDTLGKKYVAVGFTFDRGSFLSKDAALGGDWKQFTAGPAEPGSNEHTLDRVRYDDFYLDMRTAPAAARDWLAVARPTRNIGTQYPYPLLDTALSRAFDVLVHLHEVRSAKVLK
ncbi:MULTISPECIES: erythromycin esterase family protein [unclassified Nonomuraea]|uniref:erythromycin esterase family protein n=1 Tax=unclassified Nonomuraea TaxID=2593643 RepID=UPI0033D3A3B6